MSVSAGMRDAAEKQGASSEFSTAGPSSLQRLPRLIGRFDQAKRRSQMTAEYIVSVVRGQGGEDGENLAVRASRLVDCGRWITARDYYESQQLQLRSRRCRQHLLCPSCAIVRGARMMGNTLRRIERAGAWSMRPYLLTVTVKDGPSLPERLGHLLTSWGKLINRRHGRDGWGSNALSSLVGGVASIEVKRGKGSCQWHPHLHALVFSDHALDVQRHDDGRWRWPALSTAWESLTGDSRIIECHPVHGRDRGVDDQAEALEVISGSSVDRSMLGAVCEVSKYALKVSDLADEDILHAWRSCFGRRLVRTFGCLYGKLDDDGEPDASELGPFVEYCYRWSQAAAGYSLTSYRLNQGGSL